MTQFAQGNLTFFRLPSGWLRAVLILAVGMSLSAVSFHSSQAAQEADRVVIRGPQGSESEQVRKGTEQYGPIQATDTLWSIANRHRPHSSVTVPQMMAAIIHTNPDAFRGGNANEMLTGFYLRIPSLQEIQQLNPETAQVQVQQAELIARQQRILEQEEALLQQRREEQQRLVEETRAQAEAAVKDVQNNQEQSFDKLQQALLRSIESTESLYQDNIQLKERLGRLEEALVVMQEGVVTASEYETEIAQIRAEQEALKQAQSQASSAPTSMLDELLEQPGMLIGLASVPALLMILLTTWLLRRRQVDMVSHDLLADESTQQEGESELTDEEARDVLERELMDGITIDEEDVSAEDPFAGFEDEEDEGTDLERLSDEMLRATEEKDAEKSFELGEEENELDNFTELDEDVQDDVEGGNSDAFGNDDDLELLAPYEENEGMEHLGKEALDQDDLDALFESEQSSEPEFEPELEPREETSEEEKTVADDDIDSLLDSFSEAPGEPEETSLEEPTDVELLPEESEELDPLDPDVALDQSEKAGGDLNVDELLDELGIEESPAESQVDDIDALLEQTQALESELKTEPDTDLVSDDERPEEESSEEAPEQDDSFLDIDEILADAENTDEPDDSESEDDSSRAEDQLAAKLDLARAYLEMGDTDSAMEAIQEALSSKDNNIREEAEDLRKRIESE